MLLSDRCVPPGAHLVEGWLLTGTTPAEAGAGGQAGTTSRGTVGVGLGRSVSAGVGIFGIMGGEGSVVV